MTDSICELSGVPYYAVIFTSLRTDIDENYEEMAKKMVELARDQSGYIGIDSARDGVGITVSYWKDLDSINNWKKNALHRIAQKYGKKMWYSAYTIRICRVEHEYSFIN